jgi:type VI secretion system secreted protein Hcp
VGQRIAVTGDVRHFKEDAMPIYMGIFEKPNVLDKSFRGGVKAKGYEGWIELQSAQLGTHRNLASSTGRGKNREASAPAVQEIVITKLQDSVSTALYRGAFDGRGKLIVIAFVKEDGTTYTKIVQQNTLISSYNVSGHGGATNSKPTESLSLNFSNITFEMSPTSPDTTQSQVHQLRQQGTWENYP